MRLLLATHNLGKFKEIMEVMEDLPFEWESLKSLGIEAVAEETGVTYEENALQKARFYAKISGLPTVADDSGMVVAALAGELGVHTRRWARGSGRSVAGFFHEAHGQ
jgi:XTP/dITP diphosphohydrolase